MQTAQKLTLDFLPGPRGLPWFGCFFQLANLHFHHILVDWSRRFGDLYQFPLWGVRIVVTADPKVMQGILRERPRGARRLSRMEQVFREVGAHGLFSAEGNDWKKQRALVARGLGPAALRSFQAELFSIVDRLQKRLQRVGEGGNPVDIQQEFTRFTIDVSCKLAFGYDPESLIHDTDPLQHQLRTMLPIFGRRIMSPIRFWKFFKTPMERRFERSVCEIRKVIQDLILKARARLAGATESSAKSILDHMVLARDEEHGSFSDQELIGNVLTLMLAGEDTTANTLSWMAYFLADRVDLQQRLREEAETIPANDPAAALIPGRLPWIEAVALEAMRLRPVGPFLFLEMLEDREIEGISFPRDTVVATLFLASQTDPRFFSRPEEFLPERWIAGSDLRKQPGFIHNEDAFLPFGYGPRYCPGAALAMAEIKAAYAMIARNFTMRPVEGKVAREVFHFTGQPRNLWIHLEEHRSELQDFATPVPKTARNFSP